MSSATTKLLKDVKVPRFFKVEQNFEGVSLSDDEIVKLMHEELFYHKSKINKDMKIAITAGSRGIASYYIILKTIVDFCKKQGAKPFVVPAMGSHGGADAKLQKELIEGYGITEERIGCPILSSMEVEKVGMLEDGRSVYMDKIAYEADGIIVFNRIKPHTCFRGDYQSGIHKMCAIGLGNQVGADMCHSLGYGVIGKVIYDVGQVVINSGKILCAVATIENAFDRVSKIEVMNPSDIKEREPILLKEADSIMARILVDECDVLIVDEIGKNFSGDGMDPNVTGRFGTPYADGGIKTQLIGVLDLSPETHGNGIGVGMSDATTKKCAGKIVLDEMYPNSVTCIDTQAIKLPFMLENDREVFQLCLKLCVGNDKEKPRVIRIPNTSFIHEIMLSEAYYEEIRNNKNFKIISELQELPFDKENFLEDLEPRVRH